MPDLIEAFADLPAPEPGLSADPFSARRIEGFERHRVAKDSLRAPALLLGVDPAPGPPPPPLSLRHLRVQHDAECLIREPAGTTERGRFTIVRCTSGEDSLLVSYFLRVAEMLLLVVGEHPTRSSVAHAVSRLAELFHALTEPPRKSVQGLWGELFVITQSRDPAGAIAAWHVLPTERYDFGVGSQRLEVKTSTTRIRQHHFSMEQLHPPAGIDALVASLYVERASAGVSLRSLIHRARSPVVTDAELLAHLEGAIALTLGESWRAAHEEAFDPHLARDSLAYFRVEDIPGPSPLLPPGVSDVRFRSDLSTVPVVSRRWCREAGGLFRLLPRPGR
jgi:hypothetical protein